MKPTLCGSCELAAVCDASSHPARIVCSCGRVWDLPTTPTTPTMLAAATTGIVARGITHDLNNLFTCILASATPPPADRDVTRHLAAIEHAVLRGAELLALLRDLSPREDIRQCQVAPTVDACAYLLDRVGAKLGIEVMASGIDPHVAIAVASHELQQILINLGLNAIDAMAASGGELRIELRPGETMATLVVADSGPGIDPSLVARLFEPGSSTKRGHSGVGLTVVRELVERAHGTIRIDSALGAGTTVVIELPLAEAS